ncbi:alpha-N-acetylgalactosaminidase isoform X2 [Parasteatoda tepidariorum]|uniref:alpha-N-acetylgalactosaminidase isoform X2 n=1 Tax=Parasteatoda tepidariorum TaxID=114398 RepID=UPI00077FCE11|nr:alpha-N-acetylgalactosaminidase isoform X2 [Parasteatoda tepidariorum]
MLIIKLKLCFFYFVLIKQFYVLCLNNGLALTPPMGWLAWERFQCNIRCDISPENCIREELFMEMANRFVEDGFRDAGYTYINIDDCWMNPHRSKDGNLYPDYSRFRRGIKFLADYMHSRNLKLGIYQTFGLKTCMGFPGIIGHMKQDASMFASWDVDMVKLDGCFTHPSKMDEGYIEFGKFLNQTARPMIYSCSWPYYQLMSNMELLIGNFHLTPGQSRAQMAIWCIIPAPLLMSNDLRDIKPIFRDILIDKRAIAINQDHLGLPGKRIYKKNSFEVWKRPIAPISGNETSYALLFLNRQPKKRYVSFSPIEFEMNSKNGYLATKAFSDEDFGIVYPNGAIDIVVQGLDVVLLNFKLDIT